MFFLSAMACVFIFIYGCAATHKSSTGELISIAPNEFYEACDKWTPGQEVSYSFQTSDSVNFDVHYHGDSGKEYAAKIEGIAEKQGSFTVDKEALYCCMWANPNDTAVGLTYQFEVRNASK